MTEAIQKLLQFSSIEPNDTLTAPASMTGVVQISPPFSSLALNFSAHAMTLNFDIFRVVYEHFQALYFEVVFYGLLREFMTH